MKWGSERGPLAVALAGLLSLASGMGIGRFVYTPILPAMIDSLGLKPSEAGLIASANFVGYLVGALLLVSPRWLPRRRRGDRRTWFLVSLAAGAASIMAMAGATGLAAFALLRFAGGVVSALSLIIGTGLVLERLAAARAGRLAPIHFAGIGTGIATSSLLVSGMEHAGYDWRGLWFGAGLLAAVMVPVIAVLYGQQPAVRGAPAAPAAAEGPRATRPGLVTLSISYGLFGFGYIITATFLVAAVRASPAARPIEPLIWLAVGLTAIPSTLGWSIVAARIGPRPALGLALLVLGAGVAVGGIWPGAVGSLVAAGLLGLTFVSISSLAFEGAREIVPETRLARTFATLTAAFGVGQVCGPLVAGYLVDWTGSFLAPSLLAAAGLALGAGLAFRK